MTNSSGSENQYNAVPRNGGGKRTIGIIAATVVVVLLVIGGLVWAFNSGKSAGKEEASGNATTPAASAEQTLSQQQDENNGQNQKNEASKSGSASSSKSVNLSDLEALGGRTECVADSEGSDGSNALNLACPTNVHGSSHLVFALGGPYQSLTGTLENDMQVAVKVKIIPEGVNQNPTLIRLNAGATQQVNAPLNGAQKIKIVAVPDRGQWDGSQVLLSKAKVNG